VTFPDFPVSELVLNLSAPLGSAESLSVSAPPPEDGVVLVAVGVVAVLVAAGALEVVLLLLLLPQPATAREATRASGM
jgi:hypothetical protein